MQKEIFFPLYVSSLFMQPQLLSGEELRDVLVAEVWSILLYPVAAVRDVSEGEGWRMGKRDRRKGEGGGGGDKYIYTWERNLTQGRRSQCVSVVNSLDNQVGAYAGVAVSHALLQKQVTVSLRRKGRGNGTEISQQRHYPHLIQHTVLSTEVS